jgi:CII-binding regulator of phage lambda lysogenization HflD
LKQKIDTQGNASEKSAEVDHLNSEIMRYESIIGELEESLSKKEREMSELKTNINILDKQLFSYKEK